MFSIKLAPFSDTPIWLNTLPPHCIFEFATAAQKIIPHKAAIAFPRFIRLSAIFSYWGGSCFYQITFFCWSWRLMWHQEKRESNTKFIFQTPFLGFHLGFQEGKSPTTSDLFSWPTINQSYPLKISSWYARFPRLVVDGEAFPFDEILDFQWMRCISHDRLEVISHEDQATNWCNK